MGKRSGTKSSRSERKAGRERAQRARQHGLPERDPPPRMRPAVREPLSADGENRTSAVPSAKAVRASGIPTVVKVVGGALLVLLAVYLLTHYRDQAGAEATAEPTPAPASAPPEAEAPLPVSSTPQPEEAPAAAPAAPATPKPAVPAASPASAAAPGAPKPATPKPAVPAAPPPADNPY